MDDREYQQVLKVKREVEGTLLAIPGVHGVSIGYKYVNGQPTHQLAIVVHVAKKRSVHELLPSEVVPSAVRGIPLDVIEHAQPAPAADEWPYIPIKGGCQIFCEQIWWFEGTIGTLGAFVCRPSKPNTLGILTNQHVTKGSQGIWQPKPPLGLIVSGVTPEERLTETVDAAVAWIGPTWAIIYTNEIIGIGPVRGSYDVTHRDIDPLGYPVRKRGRTTELTHGKITRLDYSGTRSDGWNFKQQIFITGTDSPFGAEGDSGAVVVNDNDAIVGLFWGVPSTGPSYGFASPISLVLSALDVDIMPQAAGQDVAQYTGEPVEPADIQLRRSVKGRKLLDFREKHAGHMRELLTRHSELAAVWSAGRGNEIMTALFYAAQEQQSPLPATLNASDMSVGLEKIASALRAHGATSLADALVGLSEA